MGGDCGVSSSQATLGTATIGGGATYVQESFGRRTACQGPARQRFNCNLPRHESRSGPNTPGTDLPSTDEMEKQRSKMQSRLERTRNLMVAGWVWCPGEAAGVQVLPWGHPDRYRVTREVFPDGQGSGNLEILI